MNTSDIIAATNDERQIRDLIATWLRASTEGDLATILKLMAEDVIFLMAGQPPMRGREAFANASRAAEGHFKMKAESEVQEIKVFGSGAYCWTKMKLTIKPLPSGPEEHRAGYTLSVLRKEPAGNWVLLRDANMLAPEHKNEN
jgi:uncharacterized protein (TIGR02246 family)